MCDYHTSCVLYDCFTLFVLYLLSSFCTEKLLVFPTNWQTFCLKCFVFLLIWSSLVPNYWTKHFQQKSLSISWNNLQFDDQLRQNELLAGLALCVNIIVFTLYKKYEHEKHTCVIVCTSMRQGWTSRQALRVAREYVTTT